MRLTAILLILTLAACSSKAAEEVKKYEIVERQTANDGFRYKALCPQARAVESAYLEEGNEAKYKEWHLTAELDCAHKSEFVS